ncbi:MAG: hypothetical protein R3288_12400, partial [Woeseiaceae bacterium]|nr:hypothetical protein [Woeseiaceae bacterium]
MAVATLFCLAACGSGDDAPADPAAESTAAEPAQGLAAFLDAQPDDVKARYAHRHPLETLQFFGIEPGMTVVEGLPGRGWYSRILLNYLGPDGTLIGVNYSMDMWPLFPFANEEFLARMENWIDGYSAQMQEVMTENSASLKAFYFGSMPESLAGTADVVFFPRVLHNLANFQNNGKGDFLDIALADAYAILKPGGTFGVVQHEAREDKSDAFA